MTDCPDCGGTKWIGIYDDSTLVTPKGELGNCPTCNGTGKVKERVSLFGKVPDEDNKEDE